MTTTGDPTYRDGGLVFPDGFIIGSATASYQIEGAAREDGGDSRQLLTRRDATQNVGDAISPRASRLCGAPHASA